MEKDSRIYDVEARRTVNSKDFRNNILFLSRIKKEIMIINTNGAIVSCCGGYRMNLIEVCFNSIRTAGMQIMGSARSGLYIFLSTFQHQYASKIMFGSIRNIVM